MERISVAKGAWEVWQGCGRGRTQKRRWDRMGQERAGGQNWRRAIGRDEKPLEMLAIGHGHHIKLPGTGNSWEFPP